MTIHEDFLHYYHMPLRQMVSGLYKLVYEQMSFLENTKQFKDFTHFLDVAFDLSTDGNNELPAMMYGMIYNCWLELENLANDDAEQRNTPRPVRKISETIQAAPK